MKIQAELDALDTEIEALEDHASSLGAQAYELRSKRDALISQAILEEKLLADSTWEIQSQGGSSSSYLEFTGNWEGSMQKIREMARKDYHSSFSLMDGVDLRFDDNDMTIQFADPKLILPFAKKNNLKLSGANITDRLAKLKREVAALETLVHQFNL